MTAHAGQITDVFVAVDNQVKHHFHAIKTDVGMVIAGVDLANKMGFHRRDLVPEGALVRVF